MEDNGLGIASLKTEGEPIYGFYTGAPKRRGWWAEFRRRVRRAYSALRGETGY